MEQGQASFKKKCVDCGLVFETREAFKTRCGTCYRAYSFRTPRKLAGERGEGKRAESDRSNSSAAVLNHPGFDDEARLLEACWRRAWEFEPVPTGEQATSLAASLFISLTKGARFDRIRR